MKQLMLRIKDLILSKKESSDIQTVRLFAILAVLTLILVAVVRAVQFTPNQQIQFDLTKPNEAIIAPIIK